MGLARRLKRRDVIPIASQKKLMAQGQLQGVAIMHKETERHLKEAYDVGFNEANYKAHARMMILAVAVLHDVFGFGKIKAKRFADAVDSLSADVNAGLVSIPEIMQTLVEEKIDICKSVCVEDGNGKTITITPEELLKGK